MDENNPLNSNEMDEEFLKHVKNIYDNAKPDLHQSKEGQKKAYNMEDSALEAARIVEDFGNSFRKWQEQENIFNSPLYSIVENHFFMIAQMLHSYKMILEHDTPITGLKGESAMRYSVYRNELIRQLTQEIKGDDEE